MWVLNIRWNKNFELRKANFPHLQWENCTLIYFLNSGTIPNPSHEPYRVQQSTKAAQVESAKAFSVLLRQSNILLFSLNVKKPSYFPNYYTNNVFFFFFKVSQINSYTNEIFFDLEKLSFSVNMFIHVYTRLSCLCYFPVCCGTSICALWLSVCHVVTLQMTPELLFSYQEIIFFFFLNQMKV